MNNDFFNWWIHEGIAEKINADNADEMLRLRDICETAWENGAYKAIERAKQQKGKQ